MSDELPPGWTIAPLSTAGLWGSGGTPSRGDPNAYGGAIPWLKIGDLPDGPVLSAEETITEHGLKTSSAKLLEAGTLLVAMYGSIGKLGITTTTCATNQAIAFCKPATGLDLHYLFYLLMSERHRLVDQGQGGTQLNISQTILKAHQVPIAPTAEQLRIVSKIDELFSRIEEGKRALEWVQKLVERYRQSVLKAAVTGELTCDWREKNTGKLESGEALLARILKARREAWEKAELDKMRAKGITPANDKWKQKYEEPGAIVTDHLGDLPAEWQRVRIDAVGEVQLGRQRAPAHHDGEFMRPYLRVANVHQERIDISDVMSMNFTPDEFVTYSLRGGDILLNEGQSKELIGRPAMYRDEVSGACFTNTLVRFRATTAVLTEFALLVFLHYMKSGYFRKIAKITTNIAHLGAGRFAEMSFPVPSIEEQRAIVDAVDRQSSVYSHLITEVAGRKRHVDSLRQSVLKAAFSGALVAQDPSDEPASALIERIAAERSNSPVAKSKGDLNNKKAQAT